MLVAASVSVGLFSPFAWFILKSVAAHTGAVMPFYSLDQANQMMVRWRNTIKSRASPTWGIRLPAGFNPSSISLLADPLFANKVESSDDDEGLYRRAMLLLCNDDNNEDGSSITNYQMYQLEVDSDGTHDDSQETRFVVKAKKCSDGQLLETESSPRAPVSGVFLASASFDFDSVTSESSRSLNGDSKDSSATFHAAVGIIRSPCEGLEAVLITGEGVHDRKEIISGAGDAFTARPSSEVSSYWHSHTIPFDPSPKNENKRLESFFVWSFELCDGSMICWSVPYIGGSHSKVCV